MKHIALITGITGQDGSFLAEFLLEKGYEVHGTIRRSSVDYRERIAHLEGTPNFHLHYADLGDSMSIMQIIGKIRPTEVYNLAAQQNRIEPCLRPGAHRVVRKRALLRKFRVEQIEKRKKLPLECQQIAVGHFLMKLHHRKQKTPELADIFLHFRIRTVVVNREPEL